MMKQLSPLAMAVQLLIIALGCWVSVALSAIEINLTIGVVLVVIAAAVLLGGYLPHVIDKWWAPKGREGSPTSRWMQAGAVFLLLLTALSLTLLQNVLLGIISTVLATLWSATPLLWRSVEE